MSIVASFPPFAQTWLFPDGHSQTLASVYRRQVFPSEAAQQHIITLDDGDCVVVHDDTPPQWRRGHRIALLVHGLAGSHASPYMRRIAGRLNERGIRTFRLDLRSCGAGVKLARYPYHSGRSEDVRTVLYYLANLCSDSPIALLGFSMGANISLKLAGEDSQRNPPELESVFAACPPVDLQRCVRHLQRGLGNFYDRYFAKLLHRHVTHWHSFVPEAPRPEFPRPPRSIEEFDDWYTAPVCGFGNAANYYRESSAAQYVPGIEVPTLIIAADNDPMVSPIPLREMPRPNHVHLHITRGGGHMGFLAKKGIDPDPAWLDWRAVDWVTHFE